VTIRLRDEHQKRNGRLQDSVSLQSPLSPYLLTTAQTETDKECNNNFEARDQLNDRREVCDTNTTFGEVKKLLLPAVSRTLSVYLSNVDKLIHESIESNSGLVMNSSTWTSKSSIDLTDSVMVVSMPIFMYYLRH